MKSPPGRARATKAERAAVAHCSARSYLGSETEGAKTMTTFDDRERAFESMYARDQEMQFKVTARRNRLLGAWAAELMGLTAVEADSYAKDVVRADFEEAGDGDVIRKLLGDLTSAGVDIDEARIQEALQAKEVEARRQFMEGQG
jgi:hypothetical protein